jgi:hypothetical protein
VGDRFFLFGRVKVLLHPCLAAVHFRSAPLLLLLAAVNAAVGIFVDVSVKCMVRSDWPRDAFFEPTVFCIAPYCTPRVVARVVILTSLTKQLQSPSGLFNLPEKRLGAMDILPRHHFAPRKDAASRRIIFRDLPEGFQDSCEPSKR